MAAKPMITHKIIHAKESGNPATSGSAEEKKKYPGQTIARVVTSIITTNQIRVRLRVNENWDF